MLPIDDNEAFRIRASAGDGPDCDVNPIEPRRLEDPLPPEIPCDTPPEPEVETFYEPAPAPRPQRQPRLPAPLTLHSPELPIACPPGTEQQDADAPVVLDFGAITRTVNFSDIEVDGQPLFDQATLYNLAQVSATIQASVYSFLGEDAPSEEPVRGAYIASGLPAKIDEVISITKLSSTIVTAFWQFILYKQAELDAAALELAARQLDCGWFNNDLWVICYDRDESDYRISLSESTAPGAVFVPAGTAFSSISQDAANQLALKSAVGVISCQFANTEQTASCVDLFGGDFSDDVLFSWPTLDQPETTKISDLGGHIILNANGQISDASITGLKVLTHGEVASNGASAKLRELILRVTVPAGTTFGATQAEADAKARALAFTYLDCFIPAREKRLQCTDAVVSAAAHAAALQSSELEVLSEIATGYTMLGHLLPTIKPDNTTFIEGPALDERIAVRMILPAGAFVAETRRNADALADAFILSAASTKLDCKWRNRPVTYACDDIFDNPVDYDKHLSDELFATYGGNTYPGPFKLAFKEGQFVAIVALESSSTSSLTELMASVQLSDPYFVEVDRGEFESSIDQASADKIAAAHAMAQLNCVYCNPEVEPNCPPDGYTGDLPLPISLTDYSFDTTRGAPGIPYHYDSGATPPRWRITTDDSGDVPQTLPDAWICDNSPNEVARVVDDVSTTPLRTVDTDEICRFCNDYVTAACCASTAPGAPEVMYTKFNDQESCNDLATAFVNMATDECAGNQISDPFAIIAIPECSMFGSSKAEANELAVNIAWAQLNCLFANSEQTAECVGDCPSMSGQSFGVTIGNHTYESEHGDDVFIGVETATVEAGLFRSACSKEQADKQAIAMAEAQVVCLWGNNEQTAECPDPGNNIFHSAAVKSATIPEGTIVTDKCTPYANQIALSLAITQLFCVYTNEEQCGGCLTFGGPRVFEESDNAGTLHKGSCIDEPLSSSNPAPTCIPVDTVITPISTDYANDRARLMLPTPPCIYCNNPVDVACEPRGIPASGAVLNVSVDQCEIEAAQLCAATETAFRMAVAQLICLWTNELQSNDCLVVGEARRYFAADNAGDIHIGQCYTEDKSPDSPGRNVIPMGTVVTPLGTPAANQMAQNMLPRVPCLWCSNPAIVQCVDKGLPHSSAVLVSEVGPCIVEASVLCEASEIAFRIAVARLVCLWTNEEQKEDECPEGLELVQAGVVPADTIIAPNTGIANQIAKGIALAQRICKPKFYCNYEKTGEKECGVCEEKYVHTVEECTIPSWESQEDADEIAQGIANALTFCVPIPGCGGGGGASSSGSEPSGGSDPGSPGPGSSTSGSDKSTAIVPVDWTDTGYAALFILEAPEVRFDDVMTILITKRKSVFRVDPKYVSVCERGSIRVCGWSADKLLTGCSVRIVDDRMHVEVSTPWYRLKTLPCLLTLRLTGIRKGFKGKRFPARTREQFEANERFINSAYPPG